MSTDLMEHLAETYDAPPAPTDAELRLAEEEAALADIAALPTVILAHLDDLGGALETLGIMRDLPLLDAAATLIREFRDHWQRPDDDREGGQWTPSGFWTP